MSIYPIIPIWLMAIICVLLLVCKRKGIWPFIRQISIILLLFIINLRIMIPTDAVEGETKSRDMNVIFVVDDTISMLAKDYKGGATRLSAVKKDFEYIVDELYGAKFSMITFHNTAQVIFPFTDDAEFAVTSMESIYPMDTLYAKGTSLNTSKRVMMDMLEKAYDRKDGQVVLFYISDGEMNTEERLDSFSKAADYITSGAVMGYGTTQGGEMYVKPYYSEEEELVRDSNYDTAISKINEKNLKKLAEDMDIDYVHMDEQKNIDKVLEKIKSQGSTSSKEAKKTGQVDIYYIFVIPLALLLIYEFIGLKRRA